VVCSPPQGPPLSRTGAEDSKYELCRTTGLEGFVGKISVIKTRDGKHANNKKCDRKPNGKCTDTGVEGQQTREMQCDEWDYSKKIEGSGVGVDVIRTRLGIEPPQNVCKPVLHSGHTLIAFLCPITLIAEPADNRLRLLSSCTMSPLELDAR
jgi:hypothetical protein